MSQKPQWKGTSRTECQELVDHAITRDPTVKFLFEKLHEARGLVDAFNHVASLSPAQARVTWYAGAQAGCAVNRGFVRLEECSVEAGGGFRPPDGVGQPATSSPCLLVAYLLSFETSYQSASYNLLILQVVMCHNHLGSQEEVNLALAHELIHAWVQIASA